MREFASGKAEICLRRSIVAAILLICLASLTASFAGGLWMVGKRETTAFEGEMRRLTLAAAAADSSGTAAPARAKGIAAALRSLSGARAMLFSADGRVLADSLYPGKASPAADRVLTASSYPETAALLRQPAQGSAQTVSGGPLRLSVATAAFLPDGGLLRVTAVFYPWDTGMPAVLLAFALGLFVLLVLLPPVSAGLYERVFQAFAQIRDSLRRVKNGDARVEEDVPAWMERDELVPLFRGIEEFVQELSGNLTVAIEARRRMESLFNTMSEGLVVLDPQLRVLLLNRSAAAFLGADASAAGQNLLMLTRLQPVVNAVQQARGTGAHSTFDCDAPAQPGRILRFFVSPMRQADRPAPDGGVFLLITDVTAVRKTEQIRSDFIANASHELKTPLTTIRGFAELLDSGLVTDAKKSRHYLTMIRQESDRLLLLINDILKLSALESMALDAGGAPVSLRRIAEDAAESLQLQAKERGVSIAVTGDAGTLHASADNLTQLCINLIDNAVKYNRPGGRVDVKVQTVQLSVSLTVADTGIGIPPEAQSRVFERFYRVDKSHSRRQGGTGLGLSIVKHIVGLYRGKITLESEPGRGTTIRVELPAGGNMPGGALPLPSKQNE